VRVRKSKGKIKVSKIVITVGIVILLIFLFRPTYTPNIKGINSINILADISIGGEKQSLQIRGTNIENPVILFLHGGPGFPQISFARKYQRKLEEEFVVVNWDQRGSGKSYTFFMDKKGMTKEQLLKDAEEVIDYLCKTYNKEKIIVVGHSWGSELGMNLVKNNSTKISAYIGVGQVIDQKEGQRISYEYALELANQYKDKSGIKTLEEIGPPPYKDVIEATLAKEKIIKKYSPQGVEPNVTKDAVMGCMFSPEYNGIDSIRFMLGNKMSAETLWGTNKEFNLMTDVKKVNIPVYFCVGRYDYTTPSTLVEKYYEKLEAPYKELVWFENSAHFPHFSESDKFYELLLKVKEQ
jgi:pimeloyl-ACP methyl ester carboxylesterase